LLTRRAWPALSARTAAAATSGVVEEFARTIARELDFRHELQILERCAKNFADDSTVYIPTEFRPDDVACAP
jgi:predicted unusual protein kinase regulating ubiquinone biosynthesis (AarF/ABC1/UbiB family)